MIHYITQPSVEYLPATDAELWNVKCCAAWWTVIGAISLHLSHLYVCLSVCLSVCLRCVSKLFDVEQLNMPPPVPCPPVTQWPTHDAMTHPWRHDPSMTLWPTHGAMTHPRRYDPPVVARPTRGGMTLDQIVTFLLRPRSHRLTTASVLCTITSRRMWNVFVVHQRMLLGAVLHVLPECRHIARPVTNNINNSNHFNIFNRCLY